jgi:hypothetical protein
MRDGLGRILSRPVRLNWAGWETDTFRLQQAGWSLSADQDLYRNTMRIAFRHQGLETTALTEVSCWDFERSHYDPAYLAGVTLPVKVMSRQVNIHMHGEVDWSGFKPVDAQPSWTSHRVERLEDLVHFAPSLARTKQIILPEESVSDLLDRIVKMQEPGREEHFKRLAREANEPGRAVSFQPISKVHAQIISLAA